VGGRAECRRVRAHAREAGADGSEQTDTC
jgi:hypothetical protein